ncbi:DUF2508 family protein [Paenibacillus mucilaginosus]|uniref:DUF2508 family protein n=3 Tax=Paenibacillus mucilaginosus TaxID=61624 RepID=H6NBH8_9BACL|nr:DUF2508 family protein [Paenibacillus mucilaginosus]AEI46122.1 hypothetical protein KNP414_07635 [Paenibacillus mucilaginosus KNP414]AFC33747.1 hypothetical protein PM3016_7171 [Paenibacillus mucilaginosus 3016]MCG7213739.1 YaaL family protein [Paenibacillus mucilaginosus]WDM27457.1 DUF2508 family protein [Paenibacillus mucilaginosus]WFA22817.1 DUF2508 family protein [Paenibacillus mucilaginosus]
MKRLWHGAKKWGQWWNRKERERQEAIELDRLLLVQEIQKAHKEWVTAQLRFEYVMEKEQIDYAVFALEAAEKRFEMLLKQAKGMQITQAEVCAGRSMEGSS